MGEKYPVLKSRELISALERKGFYFKSQKGSHAKYTDGNHAELNADDIALSANREQERPLALRLLYIVLDILIQ
jgi:hypothetical protein